jgi:hypothetical protein
VPAKTERGCYWWVQVKQSLPLVDLEGNRLAIGGQINLRNTCRWIVPAKRERLLLVDFQKRQRLPLVDFKRNSDFGE